MPRRRHRRAHRLGDASLSDLVRSLDLDERSQEQAEAVTSRPDLMLSDRTAQPDADREPRLQSQTSVPPSPGPSRRVTCRDCGKQLTGERRNRCRRCQWLWINRWERRAG